MHKNKHRKSLCMVLKHVMRCWGIGSTVDWLTSRTWMKQLPHLKYHINAIDWILVRDASCPPNGQGKPAVLVSSPVQGANRNSCPLSELRGDKVIENVTWVPIVCVSCCHEGTLGEKQRREIGVQIGKGRPKSIYPTETESFTIHYSNRKSLWCKKWEADRLRPPLQGHVNSL